MPVADHTQTCLVDGEDLAGNLGPDAVHRLDRGAQRIGVLVHVVLGETAARLHGVPGHPVDTHAVADHSPCAAPADAASTAAASPTSWVNASLPGLSCQIAGASDANASSTEAIDGSGW